MNLTQNKDEARLFATQGAVNRFVRTETQRNKKKGIRDRLVYQSEDASGSDRRSLEGLAHFTPEHFTTAADTGRSGYVIAVYTSGYDGLRFKGYLAR